MKTGKQSRHPSSGCITAKGERLVYTIERIAKGFAVKDVKSLEWAALEDDITELADRPFKPGIVHRSHLGMKA